MARGSAWWRCACPLRSHLLTQPSRYAQPACGRWMVLGVYTSCYPHGVFAGSNSYPPCRIIWRCWGILCTSDAPTRDIIPLDGRGCAACPCIRELPCLCPEPLWLAVSLMPGFQHLLPMAYWLSLGNTPYISRQTWQVCLWLSINVMVWLSAFVCWKVIYSMVGWWDTWSYFYATFILFADG